MGEDKFNAVQAVSCNQLHIALRIVKFKHSESNQLHLQDTGHLVKLLSALMDVGAPGHPLLSKRHFKPLYENLEPEVEDAVTEEEVMESRKLPNQITTVFETEARALACVELLGDFIVLYN